MKLGKKKKQVWENCSKEKTGAPNEEISHVTLRTEAKKLRRRSRATNHRNQWRRSVKWLTAV